jgi:hypothetical protein
MSRIGLGVGVSIVGDLPYSPVSKYVFYQNGFVFLFQRYKATMSTSNDRPVFLEPMPTSPILREVSLTTPPKLKRQLSTAKWDDAEEEMRNNPDLHVIRISHSPRNTYWLIRYNGECVRVHEDR